MKTQPITLALILGVLPLAAGKPSAKPAAVKKVTPSVDEILALSVIADYTEAEDMELAKAADNPKLTRNLLVGMHKRRVQRADRLMDPWRTGGSYHPIPSEQYEMLKLNRDLFALTQLRLERLKL